MGSLKVVGDTARKPSTSVFMAFAAVLLGLGGLWWVRAAPPAAAAEDAAPLNRQVTVRLDDGRILTYRTGRSLISDPAPSPLNQRRYCRRSATQYPNMRVVGQDAPPAFLTRCG
jgi:hypothetical protein